jgi:hypothetical protein
MGFAFNLSTSIHKVVSDARGSIGYKHPIIAAQIRQGDSCETRKKCWTLEDVLVKARALKNKYGVRSATSHTPSHAPSHMHPHTLSHTGLFTLLLTLKR